VTNPNQAVLDALGIKGKYILECDIRLRVNDLPRVTLVQYLQPGYDETVTQQFTLTPIEPEPAPKAFDLDAECDAARARLAEWIEGAVEKAHAEHHGWCIAREIAEAWRTTIGKNVAAMWKNHESDFINPFTGQEQRVWAR